MVLEREKEAARGSAKGVVGGYVGVFPREGGDIFEDWVAFLARGDEDGGEGVSGRESLGCGLLDFGRGRCGRRARDRTWWGGAVSAFCGEDGGGEVHVGERVFVHGLKIREV